MHAPDREGKAGPAVGRRLLPAAATLLALAAGTCLGPLGTSGPAAASSHPETALADFDTVWQAIYEDYYDPGFGGADWEGLREPFRARVERAADVAEVYEILAEMVAQLGDEQTFVVAPDDLPPEPADAGAPELELEYAGVGIVIQQLTTGEFVVVHVFADGPAEEAGVLLGDVIAAVDGWRPGSEEGVAQVSERIRGPAGTRVELTLRDPAGEERTVTITRARIDARASVESRALAGSIGYLRVPVLVDEMVEDASQALIGLLGSRGLVLDLRGVSLGSLAAATRVAQWLLGAAPMGTLNAREDSYPLPFVTDAIVVYRGPVVVLTDGGTGGVAEVLAMVLQEYGRATLVGGRTQGSYQVGQPIELPGGGLLYVVLARYVSPRGEVLPVDGLVPDEEMPLPELEALRAGRDPYLERALQLLGR